MRGITKQNHDVTRGLSVKFALAIVVTLSLCGCSGPTGPTLSTPTPSSLAISVPSGQTPAVGRPVQLTATVSLSDGTTRDVTTQAVWSSNNSLVATVTAGGVVTLVTDGCATITAFYQQVIGSYGLFTTPDGDAACWY